MDFNLIWSTGTTGNIPGIQSLNNCLIIHQNSFYNFAFERNITTCLLSGFLKLHPNARSCCLALRDIEAALYWIQQNIVNFGGDPRRVTLVGHDTGAALVNTLLLQPSAIGTLLAQDMSVNK